MLLKIKKYLGIGILPPSERPLVREWGAFFNAVMLIILFWLPLQWYLQSRQEISPLFVGIANWIVWFSFFIEALLMTFLVEKKWKFLLSNWLNLLIIILVFPPLWFERSTYFALLRYLRFIVLFRLLTPQFYALHRVLSRNSFGMTLVATLIVTVLSGIFMTYIDPGIGSLGNGLWWAWQTVTTVGYGQVIPDSTLGRVFAGFLMLVGVGLFSLVSANLAAYFIERGQQQKRKKPERLVQKQLRELHDKMDKLEDSNKRVEQFLATLMPEPPSNPEDTGEPTAKPDNTPSSKDPTNT
jgi:voltage-gated potassium channel